MKKVTKFFKNDKKYLILLMPFTVFSSFYLVLLFLTGQLLGIGTTQPTTNKNKPQRFTIKRIASNENAQTLPETGDEELNNFENKLYGYSFDYNDDIDVKGSFTCVTDDCLTKEDNWNVVRLESIFISSYFSNNIMDIDYDIGLDSKMFMEPRETTIDGETYYYIISSDCYVEMLTSEYKYIDDTLWIKKENRVWGDSGYYYISFNRGLFYNFTSEEKIPELESVLKTFTF